MNWYSIFYWLTVADGVKAVFDSFSNWFTFFSLIFFIAYVVIIGYMVAEKMTTDEREIVSKWRRFIGRTFWFCFIMCFISWFGWVATPTKKDCMLIVAGGAVGNFVTSDTSARQIPADITKFLHLSLQEEIKDLDKDVKKELGLQTPKEKFVDKVKDLTKEQIIEALQNDSTLLK